MSPAGFFDIKAAFNYGEERICMDYQEPHYHEMTYQECLIYLGELNKKYGISPGLDTVKALLSSCGNPEKRSRIIHVAGTNGKGSVSTFVSYILSEAGLKVGRYISPAVNGRREAVQYIEHGRVSYISKDEMCGYISILKDKAKQIHETTGSHPTEFEMETVMAYMAFADWKCDYAVVECGMGGSLDATNAAEDKELCILTSISKDHTRFLGDTLPLIAENKAGILRKNTPAVSARQTKEVEDVLKSCAKKCGCNISFADDCTVLRSDMDGNIIKYSDKVWKIPLPGTYQAENAAVAIEAVTALKETGLDIDDDTIRRGFAGAVWNKRFEIIKKAPYIVIDGAHNPQGIAKLAESIDKIFPKDAFYRIGIMGVFKDKDIPEMISSICGLFDEIHTVTPPVSRGLSADRLSDAIYDITGQPPTAHDGVSAESLCESIAGRISEEERQKTVMVIFGSLSLTAKNQEKNQ